MTNRILPIIFILIAVGLFFGYIQPTYSGTVQAIPTDIRGYDAALRAAQQFDEKRQALVAERDALPQESLARIDAFLPDGVDNVQLILDLDAVARRSGISLSDFDVASSNGTESSPSNPAAIQSDRPYESLELTVSGVGTYQAFKAFLETVELSLRPLDLVKVTVGDSFTGVYTYDMTFRIYWLR